MSALPFSFATYEVHKLAVAHSWEESVALLSSLLLAGFIWQGRQATSPLDQVQTTQARGLAITLVIARHLWVHAVGAQGTLGFGDQAVSVFLMLSGYGLRLSLGNTPLQATTFLKRRILRVMLPYWVATAGIITADYILLGRTYDLSTSIQTFAGINLDVTTWHLDYVRWYVTFLLTAYVFFFLSYRLFGEKYGLAALFLFFFTLYILRFKGHFPLGTHGQIFAFPIGCLLATHRERLMPFFTRPRYILGMLAVTIFVLTMSYVIKMNNPVEQLLLRRGLNHAVLIAYDTAIAYIVLFVFILLGRYGRVSVPFKFLGTFSYEIFLIHGPLLIKYNPFGFLFDHWGASIGFILWLAFLTPVAMGFARMSHYLTRPVSR